MPDIKVPQPNKPLEEDIVNVVAPAGIEETSNHIKLGNYFAKTFFIFTYPRYISSGWFSPIINLAEMMDVSIHVHPMDTPLALRGFQKKVAHIEAELSERQDKGLVRSPRLETAYRDVEKLRDDLQQGTERLFKVGVYMTVYGSSIEQLNKLEQVIISTLEAKLVYIKPALFRQMDGFTTVLPVGQDKLSIHTSLNTGPVSSLFPFVSPNLTSDEGVLYGVNMHNNSLIIFDRFALPNANQVVFAKSGAGKSYATKLEILRTLMMPSAWKNMCVVRMPDSQIMLRMLIYPIASSCFQFVTLKKSCGLSQCILCLILYGRLCVLSSSAGCSL